MTKRETVSRVIDGDTFLTNSRKRSVRLANVNAPEKGTRGANSATAKLRGLIDGKKIVVTPVARDCYGRTVAKVKVNGKSVNAAMNKSLRKGK